MSTEFKAKDGAYTYTWSATTEYNSREPITRGNDSPTLKQIMDNPNEYLDYNEIFEDPITKKHFVRLILFQLTHLMKTSTECKRTQGIGRRWTSCDTSKWYHDTS